MADIESNIAIRILDAFTGPLRQLDSGLANVEDTAKRLEKRMQFAGDLNQAAEAAGRFGNALIGPLRDSVQEFASFESSMSKVSALSDQMKGSEGFERMKQQALELGAATAYSSQEAADAMAVYAQAGRDVNEILELTPQTLAAAKANGTGLAETAAIIGHTMAALKIPTKDAAHVIDVLTAGAAASDMSLTDMGTAMAYVGPVAKQAGMSLELTAAMLGKMKDAGLEASSTGVGLRAVLTRLLDPSREAQRAFTKLGFNTKALADLQKQVANGQVDKALARIGAAADKLPNEQRMKLMSQIFGMEAQTAASIAISASMDVGTKGVRAAEAALKSADGTANRLAGVMGDNLEGAMERAGGAVSGLKTAVGEVLAPTVYSMASGVESTAGKLQKWVTTQPRAAKATLEMTATMGAAALGLQGILTTMSAMTSASALLQKNFALLQQSLVGRAGLVAAAAAAGWAIGEWMNNTFDLTEKIMVMVGMTKPQSNEKPGVDGGRAQTLPGGWEINNATGEVQKWGDPSMTPAAVREAKAAGRTSQADINLFLKLRRGRGQQFQMVPSRAKPKPRVGNTMFEQAASRLDALSSPYAETGLPGMMFSMPTGRAQIGADPTAMEQSLSALAPVPMAAAQNVSIPRAITASTEEQTAKLLDALDAQEGVQRELVGEFRMMRRGGNFYGQGW